MFILSVLSSKGQLVVKGVVEDYKDKTGLAFVSVFDSSYTYTAVTNEEGAFELKLPKKNIKLTLCF